MVCTHIYVSGGIFDHLYVSMYVLICAQLYFYMYILKQTAYAGLQKSFQQDLASVQCVTLYIGMEFQPVEDALREAFLLDRLKGDLYPIPVRAVTGLPVKQDGISLPEPTQTAGSN